MTVSEKGRFCQSCQKEVIDFSKLSDEEVVKILQAQQGSICGHIKKSQLGREMYITEYRWSFPFRTDVLAGLLALAVIQPALGYSAPRKMGIYSGIVTTPYPNVQNLVQPLSDSAYTIRGRVFDAKSGEPLPFVNVGLAGTQISTVANIDGEFSLQLPYGEPQEITLEFNFVGYDLLTLTLTEAKVRSGEALQVHLQEQELLLDGVMVIIEKKDRSGKRGRR